MRPIKSVLRHVSRWDLVCDICLSFQQRLSAIKVHHHRSSNLACVLGRFVKVLIAQLQQSMSIP